MRACLAVAVVCVSACAGDSSSIRVERQAATLDAAKEDAWTTGGAVLVGATGSFSFPQPVSIRITLVDRDETEPVPQLVSKTELAYFGPHSSEIKIAPVCQPTYCTAELELADFGPSVLQIKATGKDSLETGCFYYGIYEDADPASATAAHRTELEALQQDCLADGLD